MKWIHQLCRRTKQPRASTRNDPSAGDRRPAAPKPQPTSTVQKKALEKQLQSSLETCLPPFSGAPCPNDSHDFASPYPFKCRKCGLTLQWDSQHIAKYMGSYFDGKSYQWTERMKSNDITSFSISAGDRQVLEANCDFSVLRIRSCLNGSRDGWMQSRYPKRYFEPREIKLREADAAKLRRQLASCNFFAWETPVHYVENHGAPGFSCR